MRKHDKIRLQIILMDFGNLIFNEVHKSVLEKDINFATIIVDMYVLRKGFQSRNVGCRMDSHPILDS